MRDWLMDRLTKCLFFVVLVALSILALPEWDRHVVQPKQEAAMTDERSRYRRELKTWSKNELVREVERLRAITREHADRPGEDATGLPSDLVDVAGDPFARGGVLLDARHAILMEEVDVCLVDSDPSDEGAEPLLMMLLSGRVNMRDEHAKVMFMFGADGAAAVISQLLGLAARIGPEFMALLEQRMDDLPEPPR